MDDRVRTKEKTTAAFQKNFKRKRKFNIFNIICHTSMNKTIICLTDLINNFNQNR